MTATIPERAAPAGARPTKPQATRLDTARLSPRVHLAALLGYVVLTLLLTYPIVADLATEVPGGGDAWQHIWNLWWVKKALLDLHTNPYHTNLVYYPQGANLYLHTLVLTAGLQGIPLQLLGINLVATYNLVLLTTFVLGGYGAFLLCYYLTRSPWASFVGGCVFTFAPYHFAHMYGHMNLVSLQWLPFYALVLLKSLDTPHTPGSRDGRVRGLLLALGAGALLALNAYTDWLYAIFCVLLTGLVVIWRLVAPAERRILIKESPGLSDFALRIVVVGGTFLVITAPIFFPTLAEARQGYAQQPPRETLVYSSDAVLSFLPNELHPLWGHWVADKVNAMGPYLPIKNPSERVVFVGYVTLALALYAAWRLRRSRDARFWSFVAVVTWLLSLGPELQLLGRTEFTAFGVTVPLPYLLLYKLPLFGIMRTPSRLIVLTMLALAILVSTIVAWELARVPTSGLSVRALTPRRAAFAFVLPALILFEYLSIPYTMVPPGWNVPIYSKIAQEPGNFALLELPLRPFGDYMAYQTIHGKPIIGGYLSRQPPDTTVDNTPALKYLLDTTDPNGPIKVQVENGKGVQQLRDLNVKYVIVRWWAFTQDQRASMEAKLSVLLGRPPDFSYPADTVYAWQIEK